MDTAELLRTSDLNLAESYRELSRWHANTDIAERGSLLLTCGPDSFMGLSFAMRTEPGRSPAPEAFLETARAFFAERRRGFSVRVRRHLDQDLREECERRGLVQISSEPAMVLDAPLPDAPPPPKTELRVVRDRASAEGFAFAAVEAYATAGLRRESAARQFGLPERLVAPHIHAVVAYVDGAPASCAMALMSHGVAGVYWVGTVPDRRGMGLAEHCTRAVGNEAFARGARCVVLQASVQGEPVYRRMGYRDFTRYDWYLCPTR
jgi:ribosomal protein S18 acetylase RimI-like enzyme